MTLFIIFFIFFLSNPQNILLTANAISCNLITCEESKYEINKAHKTVHIVYGLYSDYLAVLAQIIGMLAFQNHSCISIRPCKLAFRYELLIMVVEKINRKIIADKLDEIIGEIIEKRFDIEAFILNHSPPKK